MDWLHYAGQFREVPESEEGPAAAPKHPRRFSDNFKHQIVEPINAGKSKSDLIRFCSDARQSQSIRRFSSSCHDALVRAALSHYAKLELARIHEFRYLAIEVPS